MKFWDLLVIKWHGIRGHHMANFDEWIKDPENEVIRCSCGKLLTER